MRPDDLAQPSTKPYLLRAIWEWCADNGLTPHIAVAVDGMTRVPKEFVRDGQIVLNVGPVAANKLQMGNDFVEFHARFAGVARQISIPVGRISAIYARENGIGMSFELEDSQPLALSETEGPRHTQTQPEETQHTARGRPKLQRVK